MRFVLYCLEKRLTHDPLMTCVAFSTTMSLKHARSTPGGSVVLTMQKGAAERYDVGSKYPMDLHDQEERSA